jgi:hypothetical protein
MRSNGAYVLIMALAICVIFLAFRVGDLHKRLDAVKADCAPKERGKR